MRNLKNKKPQNQRDRKDAQKAGNPDSAKDAKDTGLYLASRRLVGPVLCAYVSWVLAEAQKRGIKNLYFLARDGYVLQKIAQMICRETGIQIQCSYLYCSRASLRVPSYHLIGEEAYDLIFLGGYHVTVKSFLQRAGIPPAQWRQILWASGIGRGTGQDVEIAWDQPLSSKQASAYKEKLLACRAFRECMFASSRQAYETAVGYLRQEGLVDSREVAIVDSGWTGSMQRSLRQLLESAGFLGKVTGFYFGLFQKPKEPRDGEYVCWYFTADREKRNKILFCNNLLECFLSAPHGMTAGYQACGDGYGPVFQEEVLPLQLVNEQCRGILAGARQQVGSGKMLEKRQCARILRRLMARPTVSEARLYGRFLFCDDSTEGYCYPLAKENGEALLKNNFLPVRLLQKITGQACSKGSPLIQPFWTYGTIALLHSPLKRAIYWLNEYIVQWCRFTLRRLK